MQTTRAVEAQCLAICSTTSVAARIPSPSPPTSFALTRPRSPAWASASSAACGYAAVRSISPAAGAMVSVRIGSRVSRYEGRGAVVAVDMKRTFLYCNNTVREFLLEWQDCCRVMPALLPVYKPLFLYESSGEEDGRQKRRVTPLIIAAHGRLRQPPLALKARNAGSVARLNRTHIQGSAVPRPCSAAHLLLPLRFPQRARSRHAGCR